MPKLLFLVSEDWYFCSHRLPLAIAAKNAGYDVVVATRVHRHGDLIKQSGLGLVNIGLQRRSVNPLRELLAIWELVKLYRAERPDIVHHVAIKPVIYGSVAARIVGIRAVVNALAGLGYVFSSKDARARLLRPFVVAAYRFALRNRRTKVIVQNPDDRQVLLDAGLARADQVVMIRGSGVNVQQFSPTPEVPGIPIVLLASRMLRDKGVYEFVAAARLLKGLSLVCRCVLVGDPDPANPATITREELDAWNREGAVEWWGHKDNIADVIQSSHVVCLPSYREGLPKVLLEAAACGKPIVTCDVPGCREVVVHGENGLLVPPRDSAKLADAIKTLVTDAALRLKMGAAARKRAVDEFSIERVVEETLALYRACT